MQIRDLARRLADGLESDWAAIARPNQLPPDGDWWSFWLQLGGRGSGKTTSGSQWVRAPHDFLRPRPF